jgi:hypothetical protein
MFRCISQVIGIAALGIVLGMPATAGQPQVAPPNITGEWTGIWGPFSPAENTGLAKEKCKALDCTVVRQDSSWQATFQGECGRPYKYTIKMTGRPAGDSVLFKGTTDLSEKDGGVYDWIGRATDREFIGFYTSAKYTGAFRLTRKK